MHGNEQQQIAELFMQGVSVVLVDGVDNLVRFFEDCIAQRAMGLLTIPGTSARRSQLSGDPGQG